MTDQNSENHEIIETSEVDRAVRALLGEARVDEPMPADVADRLAEALAGAAEQGSQVDRPRVVRMRRRLAGGLVAAAVLVVGGGVVVAQLNDSDGPGGSNSSADSAASGAGGSVEGSSPSALSRQPAGTTAAGPLSTLGGRRHHLPKIRSAHFAADVRRLVAATPFATTSKSAPTDSLNADRPQDDCTPPPGAGAGADVREISLDGSLATLLIDPPDAQPRRATAYSCDGGHELASTELSH